MPPPNPLPKVAERRVNLSASLQEPPSYSPTTSKHIKTGSCKSNSPPSTVGQTRGNLMKLCL